MTEKREYRLEGLGCANCANKIENDIKKLDYTSNVSINFPTERLSFNVKTEYAGEIDRDVMKIVHKYEPDVNVRHSHDKYEHHQSGNPAPIIIGGIIFAAAFAAYAFPMARVSLFLLSYFVLGAEILVKSAKNIKSGSFFDENFLMSIASIGAVAIGEYPEAAAVMLFYRVGEYFQEAAVDRSRKSIKSMLDIRPDYANLKTGDETIEVSPESVNPGDIIIVKPGERIPLDGVVAEGEGTLDTSALTGESLLRGVTAGEEVFSGSINISSLLTLRVTSSYAESTVSKILDLVENAGSKKAPTESFITRFSRYYTPVVVTLAAFIALVPPIFAGNFSAWLSRGLVFLVVSCPCALVISVPLGFFGGIGAASKKGVLIKGGNYLEALNSVDTVVFDKTGTLTKGIFEVVNIRPANGFNKEELIKYAAHAEAFSTHPIAKSIVAFYKGTLDKSAVLNYEEIPGHGILAQVFENHVLAGNDKLMKKYNIDYTENHEEGTLLYVAVNNIFAGSIVIADKVKENSAMAVSTLRSMGIKKTIMLTGDNEKAAASISDSLGLDGFFARLMPGDKVSMLEKIQASSSGKTAFVGDGINDAPVLARADVGIAMGALGSDAAIEAADIVLMHDDPMKIADAMSIAAKTRRVVWQNIVFALGIKGLVLALGAFGIAGMWEAVFADVGVSLLAVLNSMRVLATR